MPTAESVITSTKSVEKFFLESLIKHFNLDIDVNTVNEVKIMSWLKYQIGVYQILERIPNRPEISKSEYFGQQNKSKFLNLTLSLVDR